MEAGLAVCTCEACGTRFRFAEREAGRVVQCPRCRNWVQTPGGSESEPGTPFGTWATSPFRFAWRLRYIALFLTGLLLAAASFRSEFGFEHYLGLALTGVGTIGALAQAGIGGGRRGWAIGAFVVAVAAMIYFAKFDYYVHEWAEDGADYRDVHRRVDGQLVHRTMWYKSFPDGKDVKTSGPMSGRNKSHGEWLTIGPDGQQIYRWYWYGESITEGQWHDKNAR